MSLENDDIKVEVLRLESDGYSHRQIEAITGVAKSSISSFLKKESYKSWWEERKHKPVALGDVYNHLAEVEKLPGNRFILTSAQNNTFVFDKLLQTLEVIKKDLDARLLVGTYSYNKSGFQNLGKASQKNVQDNEGDIWFDPKIREYIYDKPALLAEGLHWRGELNILPTAVNPLSGMHSYTKECSGIFPHAKIMLESVPTHKTEPCKMLYTTGTVTKRNYVQKKAGQKASFHHVYGALLVEVDDEGDWFVRQLNCDEDGVIYDLDKKYTPEGVEHCRVAGVNWGDIHSEKLDPEVAEASFYSPDSILNVLKPEYQFAHDVADFETRNHHNIRDPYFRFVRYTEGKDKVEEDIEKVARLLESIERPWCQTVVVESNHDLALQRWLKEADYKVDPANAVFFLECQLAQYKALEKGDKKFSIFEWAIKRCAPDISARFLRTDESFRICATKEHKGIECGSHGHNGTNGARGSLASFIKLGARQNLGHSHTAAIRDGVYVAGVSANLDMGYNIGPSSWSNSHIVTYLNGKRAIITIKNGKWRA